MWYCYHRVANVLLRRLAPETDFLQPYPTETWLRGRDLNPRPSRYERDELPDCSTPRYNQILTELFHLSSVFWKLKNVPERFACYSRLSLPFGYSVSWHPSAPKQRRYGILALLQRTSTVGRPIHSFTLPTPATFVSMMILHHPSTLLLTVAVAQSRNIF